MSISTDEKVDFLWKEVIFGVAKTANASTKFGSNETIPSALPVLPDNIWSDASSIPTTPPGSTTSLIAVYGTTTAIHMTNNATSPVNQSWLATSTYGDASTRMTDFIAPTHGSGYSVEVWIGNPSGGPAARIFPDTTDEEWVFDYSAGTLYFVNNIPANKTATVGSGQVSVASNGVYIKVFRYIGGKGFGNAGAHSLNELDDVDLSTGTPTAGAVLTYKDGVWSAEMPSVNAGDLGTISTQDADDVNITGGSISNVTFTNVTVDGGTF